VLFRATLFLSALPLHGNLRPQVQIGFPFCSFCEKKVFSNEVFLARRLKPRRERKVSFLHEPRSFRVDVRPGRRKWDRSRNYRSRSLYLISPRGPCVHSQPPLERASGFFCKYAILFPFVCFRECRLCEPLSYCPPLFLRSLPMNKVDSLFLLAKFSFWVGGEVILLARSE